ncbi:MAG TPA: hypothetical protein VI703_11800 [Anaerolineales bacterium]|nr:hypothetical protein [Anaerolineales bacterium]
MLRISGIALMAAILIWIASAIGAIFLSSFASQWLVIAYALVTVLAGIYVVFALKVANQWEKAVVLRFGKFAGLKGSGVSGSSRSSKRLPNRSTIASWFLHSGQRKH